MSLDDVFPFRDLPWLRGVLALCLAGGALWLLAGMVAAIVRPVIVGARQTVDRIASLLGLRAEAARQRRLDLRNGARERMARGYSYLAGEPGNDAADAAARARMSAALEALTDRLGAVTGRFAEARYGLEQISSQLQQLGAEAAVQQIHLTTEEARIARRRLVMSTLVLVAMVAVNTGMLSEILNALDIGTRLRYAGVQLTYVFALLLTLAEVGIGLLHGVFSEDERDGEDRRLRIGVALTVIGAAIVAGVEGSFYGRIGENREPLVILDIAIPMPLAFFAWGLVLVLLLFGLGSVWYRALAVTAKGSVAAEVSKHLTNLTKIAAESRRQLGEVGRLLTREAEHADAASMRATDALPPTSPAVDRAADGLRGLEARTVLWTALAIAAAAAFFLVWQQTLAALYPALEVWSVRAVALGHLALFFIAGLLMRPLESTIDRRSVQGRGFGHLRNALGSILCLTVGAAGFALLAYQAAGAGVGGWLLAVPLAVALMFAGRELSGLVGFVGLVVQPLAHALHRVFDLSLVLAMRVLGIALVLVEFLLNILISPVSSLTASVRRDSGAIGGPDHRERRGYVRGSVSGAPVAGAADPLAMMNLESPDVERRQGR